MKSNSKSILRELGILVARLIIFGIMAVGIYIISLLMPTLSVDALGFVRVFFVASATLLITIITEKVFKKPST